MLYRTLDTNGDYQLGHFLKNSPETVGQAVLTRLKLWAGEWFLDTTYGTPYYQDILGRYTRYDLELQTVILETVGVTEIVSYSSSLSADRQLSVYAVINTTYGQTVIQTPI